MGNRVGGFAREAFVGRAGRVRTWWWRWQLYGWRLVGGVCIATT